MEAHGEIPACLRAEKIFTWPRKPFLGHLMLSQSAADLQTVAVKVHNLARF